MKWYSSQFNVNLLLMEDKFKMMETLIEWISIDEEIIHEDFEEPFYHAITGSIQFNVLATTT